MYRDSRKVRKIAPKIKQVVGGVHATLDPEHAQKILDGETAKSGKK